MMILEAKNLTMQFGGIKAVTEFSFGIEKGSITALIGPNGAGKTTVFNMLTGVYRPTAGDIQVNGQSLVGMRNYEITKLGLARTFQNIRLFKNLTVLENVRIALDIKNKFDLIRSVLMVPSFLSQESENVQKALSLLRIFDLESRADDLAKNLPYGAQRRLEMARAMATGAQVLLLDEPAAGMNNQETAELVKTITKIRDQFGLTIFLIEHDMKLVMGISEKIFVLDYGVKIAEGSAESIRNNPKVIEAYLGRPKK